MNYSTQNNELIGNSQGFLLEGRNRRQRKKKKKRDFKEIHSPGIKRGNEWHEIRAKEGEAAGDLH